MVIRTLLSYLLVALVAILFIIPFFIIALLNGILTSRVRHQEKKIRIREERTNALYQLTKDLAIATGNNEVTKIASGYIHKYFKLNCFIFLKNELNQLESFTQRNSGIQISDNELSVADWVFKNSVKAGK